MKKRGLLMVLSSLIFAQIGNADVQSSPKPISTNFEANLNNLSTIDSVINNLMQDFNIPAASVAVVADGKVVLAKGYGLRDIEKQKPATENTLFPIGSCTKSFTTFILGQLVDEGKIQWDDPVIKYLPDFRLADQHATHKLTIRDLVTHRCGLPRYDLIWYGTDFSRSEIISRLQYLEPSYDLREKFQYNNITYAVAGVLIEKVTGQSWEDAVQTRIFAPLGMNQSNLTIEETQKSDDFASPYAIKDDKLQKVPFRALKSVAPAGSINSCATDMAKWLQTQLLNDKNLVRKETLQEMHSIQTPDATSIRAFDYHEAHVFNFGYGLGWVVGTYKGHYYAWHNGGIDGFISNTALLPHDKIGVVVLCNSSTDGHYFVSSLSHIILDKLLGQETTDWKNKMETLRTSFKAATEAKKNMDIAKEMSTPIRPLTDYVGTYEHPGCGTIEVFLEDNQLAATCSNIPVTLTHKHYDIFKAASKEGVLDGEVGTLSFINNVMGEIAEVHVPLEPQVKPIVFKKKPSNALLAKDYLKQFEGVFENDAATLQIYLKANQLMIHATGQAPAELIPEKPFYFSVKGMQGITVHFIPKEDGKIDEVQAIGAGGIFSFKTKPMQTSHQG